MDFPQQNHVFSAYFLFFSFPINGGISRSLDGPVVVVGGTLVFSVSTHDFVQQDLVFSVYSPDLVVGERHVLPPVGVRGLS